MVNGFGRRLPMAQLAALVAAGCHDGCQGCEGCQLAAAGSGRPFEFTYGDVVGMLWVKDEAEKRGDRLVLFNVSKMVDHMVDHMRGGETYTDNWRLTRFAAPNTNPLTWAWATRNEGDTATLNIAEDDYAAKVVEYIDKA